MSEDLRKVEPWKGIVLQLDGTNHSPHGGPVLGYPRRELASAIVIGTIGLGHPEAHIASGTAGAKASRVPMEIP